LESSTIAIPDAISIPDAIALTDTIAIPESDPFDVLLAALTDLQPQLREDSGRNLFNFLNIPNFTDQYDMLEIILSFASLFYQYRGRYALAEHYCRVLYECTRENITLLNKEFGPRDEWAFEVADVLVDLGEALWLQGKEAEAKECFDKALSTINKTTTNTAEKKVLVARVMRNDWKLKTQFSDYSKSKERG